MKKKIIVFGVLFVIVFTMIVCVFIYYTTGNECKTDEKNIIRTTIEKALRIKYGWTSKEKIKDISTKEFQENLDKESFYNGFTLYVIDKNFMESYYQENENTIVISVVVYKPDIFIPIFTLTKTKDGQYLISNVEYDI